MRPRFIRARCARVMSTVRHDDAARRRERYAASVMARERRVLRAVIDEQMILICDRIMRRDVTRRAFVSVLR